MLDIQSVKTNTLQETVFDELLRAIITGVLPPGERITIRSLAKKLGVSVMPVREALRRLEAMGCINSENRKIRVNELSLANMSEIYELRLSLETALAGLACHYRTDSDIALLEEIHEQYKEITNSAEFLEVNKKFHFTIYQLSRKPITFSLVNILWDRISPYLYILSKNMDGTVGQKTVDNHSGMIESLRDRDEKNIKECITKDLKISEERIENAIKHGEFDAAVLGNQMQK